MPSRDLLVQSATKIEILEIATSTSLPNISNLQSPWPNLTSLTQLVYISSFSIHTASSANFLLFLKQRNINRANSLHLIRQDGCKDLENLHDPQTKCFYIKTRNSCSPNGYIDYLNLFYCLCGNYPPLGYTLLALCLLVLFYLLGSTASQYFCSSLESLSKLLRLPPTIAGVTLLSLGNGAPDVFATIVSFAGSGVGEVGLNSVLGGAFFVSSVVVGVISISVGGGSRLILIDRSCFLRDIGFFIVMLCFLLAVLVVGEIGIVGAISFVILYIVYVFVVSVWYCWSKKDEELGMPLLDSVEVEEPVDVTKQVGEVKKPNWFSCLVYILELPLYLPRRLTIPNVSEEKWSKPFAVASVTLSPILLANLWNTRTQPIGSIESSTISLFGGLVGLVLGIVAMETTEGSSPPKKFLFPWLAGGFLMSIVWTYITAGELVSLLVSVGHILEINPSILGVTVLAWGNSTGDLIANVAMALNGGEDGAQIAISGCYAGPIFNTLVGLGLSLVLSSWTAHPSPFVIPRDSSLFETLGFLIAGLLWALVILPRRGMKLDRLLGSGLLAIYLCFLCLRVSESIGLVFQL